MRAVRASCPLPVLLGAYVTTLRGRRGRFFSVSSFPYSPSRPSEWLLLNASWSEGFTKAFDVLGDLGCD